MNSKVKSALWRALKWLKDVAFHNLGLKALSVVCALFLWSYVVSSSPTITREKPLSAIPVGYSGVTQLESRGLAVATDLSKLNTARVQVRTPQSYFSQVSGDNVRVELDFSDIETAGTHQARLRGTSTYGIVADIVPEFVTLEVESREQRYVPVNVELSGGMEEGYWYGVSGQNPSQIAVTGPASLVSQVAEARVSLDVSDRHESHSREARFDLRDDEGNPVSGNFTLSTSSVRVDTEVCPARSLPVAQKPEAVLQGKPAEGYEVGTITVTPSQITAAGEEKLLAELTDLALEPISVEGMSQSFTAIARVRPLSGIRHLSSDEVTVNVEIRQQNLSRVFESVPLKSVGLAEGLAVADGLPKVTVRAEGPYEMVKAMTEADVMAYVDMNGLGQGQYELPVVLSAETDSELTMTCTPGAVGVTLTPSLSGEAQ